MLRSSSLSRMLWAVVGASGVGSAGACGRVGFGDDGVDGSLMIVSRPQLATECGVPPAAGSFEIANEGEVEVRIADVEGDGGFSLEDPLPIAIPPGETITLAVRPPAAVIGTDRGGDLKTGALTLVTSAGRYTIDLSADVFGANVEIGDMLGLPLTLTFSGPQCPGPITAVVLNKGNRPATVAENPPSSFRLSGFASGAVVADPGSSTVLSVRPYTTSACTGAEALSFTVTGSVCTTTPIVLAASFDLVGSTTCSCT